MSWVVGVSEETFVGETPRERTVERLYYVDLLTKVDITHAEGMSFSKVERTIRKLKRLRQAAGLTWRKSDIARQQQSPTKTRMVGASEQSYNLYMKAGAAALMSTNYMTRARWRRLLEYMRDNDCEMADIKNVCLAYEQKWLAAPPVFPRPIEGSVRFRVARGNNGQKVIIDRIEISPLGYLPGDVVQVSYGRGGIFIPRKPKGHSE